jgi:2-iminobutanoate/2-iminopropanoate deaminase
MRRIIETGLVKPQAPHEWAISSNGILYSVHVPIRPDGSVEDGEATKQIEVTLADLEKTLKSAGVGFKNVTLVQIYLTSLEYKPALDEIYRRYFVEPYPVRACVAVSELPTRGTIVEMVVTATLSQ